MKEKFIIPKAVAVRLEFLCQCFLEEKLNSSKRVPLELNCVYPMNILFIFKFKRPYNRQARVWYQTLHSALNTDPDKQSLIQVVVKNLTAPSLSHAGILTAVTQKFTVLFK